jgi:signal transduction histidine kinase
LQEYSNEPISNKSEIQVEIIDFGIGIPEEDQNYLILSIEQVIRNYRNRFGPLYC